MNYHYDKTFTDEEVKIDGNSFKNCTFIRCRIVYEGIGGSYDISGFHMIDCRLIHRGPAGNTIVFFANLYKAGARQLVENTIDYHITGNQPQRHD